MKKEILSAGLFIIGLVLLVVTSILVYRDWSPADNKAVVTLANPTTQIISIPKNECTLFVSTTGADSKTGVSEEQSLKTLEAAAAKAKPGSVICIKGGLYRQVTKLSGLNGTANAPIIIGGYSGGGLPNFTGGENYALPDPTCKNQEAKHQCRFDPLFIISNSNHVTIIGIDVSGSSGKGLISQNNNNIKLRGARLYHNWGPGLQAGSDQIDTGYRNDFDNIALYDNIRQRAENGVVGGGGAHINQVKSGSMTNSLIFRNYGEGFDVHMGAANFDVTNNMVWENSHGALYLNGPINSTIDSNFIFCTGEKATWLKESGLPSSEGNGSAIIARNEEYVTSKAGEGYGSVISNNVIVGCSSGISVAAQRTANLTNLRVVNNTIVNVRGKSKAYGINVSKGTGTLSDIIIANNLIHVVEGQGFSGAALSNAGVKMENNLTSTSNNTSSKGISVTNFAPKTIIGAKQILNPTTISPNDFYIDSFAVAVNKGRKIEGTRGFQDSDFYRNPRSGTSIDLGAYIFNQGKTFPDLYGMLLKGAGFVDTTPTTPIDSPIPTTLIASPTPEVTNTATQTVTPTLIPSNTPTTAVTGNICGKADIDGDGRFNITDFAEFARAYGRGSNACADKDVDYGSCGGRDVNKDGKLNIADFGGAGIGFAQRYYPKTSCAL
jgi:hypothetical protein